MTPPATEHPQRRSASIAIGLFGALLVGLGLFPALQAFDLALGLDESRGELVRVETDATSVATSSVPTRTKRVIARSEEGAEYGILSSQLYNRALDVGIPAAATLHVSRLARRVRRVGFAGETFVVDSLARNVVFAALFLLPALALVLLVERARRKRRGPGANWLRVAAMWAAAAGVSAVLWWTGLLE